MASPLLRWLFCGHLASVTLAAREQDVLVNLTLIFADRHPSNCISLIHKTNLSEAEDRRVFQAFKALASRTKETIGVYSYESYAKSRNDPDKIDNQRRNCLNAVKYVIGSEDSGKEFSRLTKTMAMGSGFWLVILDSSVNEFFLEARTPFNVELIAAKIESRERIEFHDVYRVDDHYPLRTTHLGLWTPQEGLRMNGDYLYERRFNLEGKPLRVGFIENWPMASFRNGGWDGYFPRIWKELEKLINCTTLPIRSVDNWTGVRKTNGTWNGLVGMALSDELDVILSEITMNDERSTVLKFSRPILISNYQVFFCALGSDLKWSAVLNPFSRDTWSAVCIWVMAGTSTISLCYHCMNKSNGEDEAFTPTSSFFFILQSLCQQGYPNVPRSLACKIIFMTSYLLSAVLIPSYSAWLIYSLTHHTPNKPFNTFEEFLSIGKYELNVIRNSAQQTYFKRSTNHVHRMVYEKVRKSKCRVQSVEEGLERSLCNQDDQAFFGVEAIVKMHLQQSSVHSCCQIVTFAKPLSPVYQSLAFLKDSPYSELINFKLQSLFTSGIIDKIQKHFQYSSHAGSSYKQVEVRIQDVFQIFILLLIGLGLSGAIFVSERFHAGRLTGK